MNIVRWLILIPMIFTSWWAAVIVTTVMGSLLFHGVFVEALGFDKVFVTTLLMPVISGVSAYSVVFASYHIAPSHKNIIGWLTFLGGLCMLLFMFRDLAIDMICGDFTHIDALPSFLAALIIGVCAAFKLCGFPRLSSSSNTG